MDLTELFHTGRACLPIDLKGSVSASNDGFRDRYPGIVVAEDTAVFLVSRRVGGNFAQFHMISGISGFQKSNAVFGVQNILNTIERLECLTGLFADACQDAEALGLDVDLTLFALVGSDFITVCVIGADEPLSVPAVSEKCLLHDIALFAHRCSFVLKSDEIAQIRVLAGIFDEHSADEYRLGNRSFTGTGGLEGFTGML